ncbi:Macrolide export protein MacA [Aquisphaera giovannonii]|uniref:Macrolide export protein MacA n=1 Tax=Aquisphaera giovannonii TaxID=406548 RepID=A0A5B9VY29_9BACT|nr:efflux RND transporter periplasmic adaptor subunit [Aquisphaera giovannonii]QEH33286.1 Macrolide export protein MacA [Aquisphaera giovannonii]
MSPRRNPWVVLGKITLVAITTAAAVGAWIWMRGRRDVRPPAERYAVAEVKRADLYPSLSASGRVESSVRTVVECELENVAIGVMGQPLYAGGSSVLLTIVPEGSAVKKGDVLATLDSSEYDELLRQQQMTVERSRADMRTAELNMEVAELAVLEFRDGSMTEARNDFQRSISMAEADMFRVNERLDWSRRMWKKGYVPKGQVISEEFNQAKAEFSLSQERAAYDLFTHWMAPSALRKLQVQASIERNTVAYQRSRLARNLDRLHKLERLVAACTIRAPHDGYVIYANDQRRGIVIESGMFVRQKQDLMYLPDLNRMEVVTALHESLVKTVGKGMHAKVFVEGFPGRQLEGRVTDVAALPTADWRSDVRYFDGKVRLDHPPANLRPGMTAQVVIDLGERSDVLTVPALAVTREEGREYCYVVHDEGLERRQVKLGEGTSDLLEISEGLREGESVVVNPDPSEVADDMIEASPAACEGTLAATGGSPAADAPSDPGPSSKSSEDGHDASGRAVVLSN